MANTQAIRRRITSTKNTRQITKAMELVSASKMRRAQESALKTRAYRNTARQILKRLEKLNTAGNVSSSSPLFDERPVSQRLYIVITSDRGLAGAYNNNVIRLFNFQLQRDEKEKISSSAIVIGKKAASFVSKIESVNLLGVYTDFSDRPNIEDIKPILQTATKAFLPDDSSNDLPQVEEVVLIYTEFHSSINQEVTALSLLPATVNSDVTEDVDSSNATNDDQVDAEAFEPSPQAVLDKVVPKLVEAQAMQAFLEATASEHSMRMLAMKNASDNANDLIDDLTLAFNSARQAAITQEIAEITGGAVAIN